jgi:hypothetical protein
MLFFFSEPVPFFLPPDVVQVLRTLVVDLGLNGGPVGGLMTMYQRRQGSRLDVQKYGFRSAVEAMRSLPGVEVREGVLNAQPTFLWLDLPEGDYEQRHRLTLERREQRQRDYELGLEHMDLEEEDWGAVVEGERTAHGSMLPK